MQCKSRYDLDVLLGGIQLLQEVLLILRGAAEIPRILMRHGVRRVQKHGSSLRVHCIVMHLLEIAPAMLVSLRHMGLIARPLLLKIRCLHCTVMLLLKLQLLLLLLLLRLFVQILHSG